MLILITFISILSQPSAASLITLPFYPPYPALKTSTVAFLHVCYIRPAFALMTSHSITSQSISSLTFLILQLHALTHPHHILTLYTLSHSLSISLLTLHVLPGIVRSHTECVELVSQKLGGKVLFKRELTVYDQSNTEVRLTLWGDKGNSSSSSFLSLRPLPSSFLLFSSLSANIFKSSSF